MRPTLLTFDIFGTVVDWQRGLNEAIRAGGLALDSTTFDRLIDEQGEMERGPYRPYAEIVAASLIHVLRMEPSAARSIGDGAGRWPLYPDSRDALRRLKAVSPCAATTNSDRTHGEQVQAALGYRLTDWICSGEIGIYKPDPRLWHAAAKRLGVAPGPQWWHVSAYGDYDLATARALGLTCVYVTRPHARPGPADVTVANLTELAGRVERLSRL
jgi:2-haloacid dehalogenase